MASEAVTEEPITDNLWFGWLSLLPVVKVIQLPPVSTKISFLVEFGKLKFTLENFWLLHLHASWTN